MEAHALGNLGAALRDVGDLANGYRHMHEGFEIRKKLDPSADLLEDAADLALGLLVMGRVAEALEIVSGFERSGQQGARTAWYPQDAWWIAARVYAASGEQRAYQRALPKARGLVQKRLSSIGDQGRADRYARIRYNPEILAAWTVCGRGTL